MHIRLLLCWAVVAGCATVPTPTPTGVTTPPALHTLSPATPTDSAAPTHSPSQSASLSVENHESFPIDVRIGGVTVATVGCNGRELLTPGEGQAPQLPWNVSIVQGGSTIFERTVDGLPQWYVQFLDGHGALFVEPVNVSGLEWARCPPPTPPSEAASAPIGSSRPGIVETHDRFWDPFVDFGPPISMPFGLVSVRDATELADVVLLGSITDLYIGEQWPDDRGMPMAYVTVEIDEVLKGKPVSRTQGIVEVQFGWGFFQRDFDAIASEPMPEGDYLWFLIREAEFREKSGQPPRDSEIAPFAYFIPNEVQGVVLNANGIAEVVLAERFEGSWGVERFPMTIRRQTFESVVEEVRDLVGSRDRG